MTETYTIIILPDEFVSGDLIAGAILKAANDEGMNIEVHVDSDAWEINCNFPRHISGKVDLILCDRDYLENLNLFYADKNPRIKTVPIVGIDVYEQFLSHQLGQAASNLEVVICHDYKELMIKNHINNALTALLRALETAERNEEGLITGESFRKALLDLGGEKKIINKEVSRNNVRFFKGRSTLEHG